MKNLFAIFAILSTAGCVIYNNVDYREPAMDGCYGKECDKNDENYSIQYSIEDEEISKIITPQDYGILATRITNKMIDDTAEIYQKVPQPKIYVRKIVKESDSLPDGFYYADKNVMDIIKNSKAFEVVNVQSHADYHLQSSVFEYINSTSENPLVLYNMKLLDKRGNVVSEWVESINQLANDDMSWW